MVAAVPETAVAALAAATRANTRVSDSRRKGEPKNRWTKAATITASNALQAANASELHKLRSPSTFATMVAATVPTMTGRRATGPSPINTPEETPAAGQNNATPSGRGIRERKSGV